MKVVGLLSGGKDSCFNLMHAVAQGHTPIAVASLVPPPAVDEMDSFMYQTVGLSLIPLLAEALDLPLYRRVITGGALNVAGDYGARTGSADRDDVEQGSSRESVSAAVGGGTKGDETEDLYELLSEVKVNHPDLEAVSVGAILSSYQRVRVEHVCARLKLTPLAYLWQRSQSELMTEMINSGLTSVLIKVAGAGLLEKHLGKTLGQMEPTLRKLNDTYGSHICGEGGEYETLTLDCPLFHSRVQLDETTIVTTDPSDFAPVAHLKIQRASLVPKPDHRVPSNEELLELLGGEPDLLDDEAESVRGSAADSWRISSPSDERNAKEESNASPGPVENSGETSFARQGGWVAVGGVTAFNGKDKRQAKAGPFKDIEDEVVACFQNLRATLAEHSLSLTSIASISLLISEMSLFPRVNTVYRTFFGSSPPTRACVGIRMPQDGERVRLEAVAFDGPEEGRKALHVQGLSHWAPANIGPYSQAVIVNERITLAGQIPLIPATLNLASPKDLPLQAALSLKHVRSILLALHEGTGGNFPKGYLEGCVAWLDDWQDLNGVRAAWETGYEALMPSSSVHRPPTLYVLARELPKNARIEWQVSAHTGRPAKPLSEEEDEDDDRPTPEVPGPVWSSWGGGADEQGVGEWEEVVFELGEARWGAGGWKDAGSLSSLSASAEAALSASLASAFSLRVFHQATISPASSPSASYLAVIIVLPLTRLSLAAQSKPHLTSLSHPQMASTCSSIDQRRRSSASVGLQRRRVPRTHGGSDLFGLDENADRCPGYSLYDDMASDDHMILDGGCDMHACYAIL